MKYYYCGHTTGIGGLGRIGALEGTISQNSLAIISGFTIFVNHKLSPQDATWLLASEAREELPNKAAAIPPADVGAGSSVRGHAATESPQLPKSVNNFSTPDVDTAIRKYPSKHLPFYDATFGRFIESGGTLNELLRIGGADATSMRTTAPLDENATRPQKDRKRSHGVAVLDTGTELAASAAKRCKHGVHPASAEGDQMGYLQSHHSTVGTSSGGDYGDKSQLYSDGADGTPWFVAPQWYPPYPSPATPVAPLNPYQVPLVAPVCEPWRTVSGANRDAEHWSGTAMFHQGWPCRDAGGTLWGPAPQWYPEYPPPPSLALYDPTIAAGLSGGRGPFETTSARTAYREAWATSSQVDGPVTEANDRSGGGLGLLPGWTAGYPFPDCPDATGMPTAVPTLFPGPFPVLAPTLVPVSVLVPTLAPTLAPTPVLNLVSPAPWPFPNPEPATAPALDTMSTPLSAYIPPTVSGDTATSVSTALSTVTTDQSPWLPVPSTAPTGSHDTPLGSVRFLFQDLPYSEAECAYMLGACAASGDPSVPISLRKVVARLSRDLRRTPAAIYGKLLQFCRESGQTTEDLQRQGQGTIFLPSAGMVGAQQQAMRALFGTAAGEYLFAPMAAKVAASAAHRKQYIAVLTAEVRAGRVSVEVAAELASLRTGRSVESAVQLFETLLSRGYGT